MTAVSEDATADLNRRIAELEQRLDTALIERDAAIERQTASALVNFRLQNELRATAERQNASAEILRAIANTHGDSERALQRIAEATQHFFNSASVTIRIAEGDHWIQTVRVGSSGHLTGSQPTSDLATPGANLPATIYHDNRQIHIPDLDNIDPSMADWPVTAGRAAGIRTICGSPLRRGETAIGALIVYRDRLAPFTPDELALQQSFADQAVIAIENARLFNETQEALERQTATSQILRVIASSPSDVAPVFEAIVNSAKRLLGGFSASVLSVRDGAMHLEAFTPLNPEVDEILRRAFPLPLTEYTPLELVRRGESVQFADALEAPEFQARVARARGFRSIIHTPLMHNSAAIGLITVTRLEIGSFADHHVQLLKTFADQAVIAIENTWLFNETQEALERQTATADILKVIASSPSDVQPVFDAIAERSNQLVNGSSTSVLRLVDDALHLMSYTRISPEADAALRAFYPLPLATFMWGEAVRRGEIVHFSDSEDEAVTPAAAREVARARGWRSAMFLPLLRDQRPIGVISVTRREVGPFADHHIQQLQTFADQAVIAIENTRLFNETQEALERQTATAEILRVINNSAGDLTPVFETILEKAHNLCAVTHGTLLLYDGKQFRVAAVRGLPEGLTSVLRRGVVPAPNLPHQQLLDGARFAQITNWAEIDDPIARASLDAGIRITLYIPLRREGKLLGYIAAARPDAIAFSEREIALLESFADQAAIAIENARLFNETQEALARQTATADILRAISQSPTNVQPVFDAIVQTAVRLLGCEMAFILRCDGVDFWAVARCGREGLVPVFNPRHTPIDPSANFPSRAIVDRTTLHLPDWSEVELPEFERRIQEALGYQSAVYLPLVREEECIGVLAIAASRPRMFGETEIALAESFRDQALIAIENTRLFNETQEALARQTATSDILRVISQSPTDVQPVFDAIVQTAVRLLGCETAFIQRSDGVHFWSVARCRRDEGLVPVINPRHAPVDPSANFPSRAIVAKETLHLPDWSEIELPEFERGIQQQLGYNSAVYLPLVREEECIGVLGIAGSRPRMFGATEIALAESFRDQAVIAIENTRLFNETQEALERQTATAEILKVIASSPSDTQPVFAAIAASANRLLGGYSTAVFRLSDGTVRLAAFTPTIPAADEALRADFPRPVDTFPPIQLTRPGEPFAIPDTEAIPYTAIREIARVHGFRSMLFVPLMNGGSPIGVISVTRAEPSAFAPHHVQLLQTFADQAVIAIENTRLFKETQEALERQTATADILRVISQSPTDVQPVFDAVVLTARRLLRREMAFILNCDETTFRNAATAGPEGLLPILNPTPMPIDAEANFPSRAIVSKTNQQIPDWSAIDLPEQERRIQELYGMKSALYLPMLRGDQCIGLLGLGGQQARTFSEADIALAESFRDQAVIAIENVRLFNETQEALERQTATADILKVIASSPSDVQPVFEAIVNSAASLFEPCAATITTLKHGELHWNATAARLPGFDVARARAIYPIPFDPERSPSARAVLERQVIEIPDIESPDTPEFTRNAAAAGGFRSITFVPLVDQDRGIGTIIFTHPQAGFKFTDKQLALVQTFADQAVIAIENTRLFNEVQAKTRDLEESLQQQTATADVLKVISRSAFDLQAVLDTLVESAARLCEADHGIIVRPKDDQHRVAASWGLPPETRAYLESRQFVPGENSAAGRALLEACVIHIKDVFESPDYVLAGDSNPARTRLAVPLLREGRPIGVFALTRSQVQPFTDKQIELVQTFADQAVIAMENARLFDEVQARTRELTESLQQQTATSEVLQIISSSPNDLAPVFEKMLENATRVCGAEFGSMMLLEGDAVRQAALYNAPPEFAAARAKGGLRFHPQSAMGEAIRSKGVVQVEDMRNNPGYLTRSPPTVELVELGGARTIVVVPMLRDDQVIGSFTVYRQEVRPFSEKQTELLTNFARQAVIAIENARLLRELRQRTDDLSEALTYQTGSANILRVIASSPTDVGPVLQAIVDSACELCEAYDAVVLLKDGNDLRVRAHHGPIHISFSTHAINREWTAGRAFVDQKAVHVHDLQAEHEEFPDGQELAAQMGHRTIVSVPLMRETQSIGAIVLRRTEVHPFSGKQIALLQTFADQAVIAIGNVRLFEEVQTRTRELSKSLEDLRTAQDRLIQTEKLASLGQLTAGIAHEIKNPLNFVNNFAALSAELTDELKDALKPAVLDETIRSEVNELTGILKDNLSKVVQHGKRADSIVKNMLLHSREGSGDHRPADVNALVDESLNLAYHGARAEKPQFNVTLERDFDPEAGMVEVFPQEITRVLLNLISNGFYAVTKRKADGRDAAFEPTVIATTKGNADHVEIRIRDNGTGIPPEVKEKMFNPFFTTKPAGEGTGLGLSMSHDIIVKQHGGNIEVETKPGAFTEFRIVLPRTSVSGKTAGN